MLRVPTAQPRTRVQAPRIVVFVICFLAVGCYSQTSRADVFLPGDGTNTEVLQLSGLPTGDGSRSYLAWVDLTAAEIAVGGTIIGHGSVNPSTYDHRSAFQIFPNGQLNLAFQVGYVHSTVAITAGSWVQVAATYSSSVVSLFINGQQVSSQAGVNGFYPPIDTINVNNNAATFGYEYNITNGYTDITTTTAELTGNSASASIWDRALSPSEILADYTANGALPDTNGLLANVWGSVPTPAPEPSSISILMLSLAGLWLIRRGRRRC